MKELEFLKKIKEDISTAHFGEGVSFNLSILNEEINTRIEKLEAEIILQEIFKP